MTYMDFTLRYIKKQSVAKPIYTREVAEAIAEEFGISEKTAALRAASSINRILSEEKLPSLRRYQKGIYYKTEPTFFGEAVIDKARLIQDKYLLPDIGYETGESALHRLGLTTWMPNKRTLATNVAKQSIRYDQKLDVWIRPAKTKINRDNMKYLQTLDVLSALEGSPVDAEDPYGILAKHIERNKLHYDILLAYAAMYYNQKTIFALAETAKRKEIKHETTRG